jgi:hypothetical protein
MVFDDGTGTAELLKSFLLHEVMMAAASNK